MRIKWLIVSVGLLALVGCATKLMILEHDQTGKVIRTIEAEDYSIKTPTLTAVPSRWLTPDFVGEIIKGAIGWKQVSSYIPAPSPANIIPTPSPTPPPVPTPTPYPAPTPTPNPLPPQVVPSVFTTAGNVITLDLNTLPGSMRKAGFDGSDNALYYSAAFVYAYGPGSQMPDDSAGSLVGLNKQRQAIWNWFDGEVLHVKTMMLVDDKLKLVAISGDGRDRCGFRLGPAILERLKEFQGRISLGQILPPEQY